MGKTTTLIALLVLLSFSRWTLAYEFVPNIGQWDTKIKFRAEVPMGALYLERDAFTYHFIDYSPILQMHGKANAEIEMPGPIKHHSVRMKFIGANPEARAEGNSPLAKYYNYFQGSDESRWKGNIHPYKQVGYKQLYEGIDLYIHDDHDRLKYEYHLAPGADASLIQVSIQGADEVLVRDGLLEIRTSILDIRELKPFAYQIIRGEKSEVPCEFRYANGVLSYHFPVGYNASLPLVIDPEVIFSTYSGSLANNFGFTATYDDYGFLYSGGTAFGNGYPVTTGAYQDTITTGIGEDIDIVLSKYDTSGTFLVYSTYIGGSGHEMPHSLVVGEGNELYMLGTSGSDDYPTTTGAFDRNFSGGPNVNFPNFGLSFPGGTDMVLTRFNASGTGLVASTFLGGTGNDGLNTDLAYNYADEARGEIELDNEGYVYLASCTQSDDYPVKNAFQPSNGTGQDGCIMKLSPDLNSILWGTYLGGSLRDACYSVAVGRNNDIYVTGGTNSTNFPMPGNGYDNNLNGGRADAFVAHFSPDGDYLHGTFYGTSSYDQAYFVELDRQGNPHLLGQTEHNPPSGSDLIFNVGYFQIGGGQFIVKFNPQLNNRLLGTQWGSTPGQPNISPTAFLVDLCNSIYISGWGGNTQQFANNNASNVNGLDVSNDAFQTTPDNTGSDFYLLVLPSDVSNNIIFGSFYGGDESDDHVDGGTSRFDRKGKIYQAVCASCGSHDDFPTTEGAVSVVNAATGQFSCNNAVFKVDFLPPTVVADFEAPLFGCAPFTVNFKNLSKTFTTPMYNWGFDDGSTSTSTNPSHTFQNAGTYNVMLVITDNNSCNISDTIFKKIIVSKDTAYSLDTKEICRGKSIVLGPDPDDFPEKYDSFEWSPSGSLNNSKAINPIATPDATTTYTLTINYNGCQEIITQTVEVDNFPISLPSDTILCSGFAPFTVTGSSPGTNASYLWSDQPDFSNVLSSAQDLTITPEIVGDPVTEIYFQATAANGCSNWDTFSVARGDLAYAMANDTSICLYDSIEIAIVPIYPNEFYPDSFYWAESSLSNYSSPPVPPQIGDSNSHTIRVSPATATQYFVQAVSTANCPVYDSVLVKVSSLDRFTVLASAAQDSAYKGEPVQLHGEPGEPFHFSWSPTTYLDDATSTDPVSRPFETVTYEWTVSDTSTPACSFKDTVTIRVYEILCGEPEIFVPSGFTPNADNRNDEVRVHGRNIRELSFSIYNRWGELVFETTNINKGWDGTFKGAEVTSAVYVYHLQATCLDGQYYETEGNITILR